MKQGGLTGGQEKIYPFLDGYDEVGSDINVCREYSDLKIISKDSHLFTCRTCQGIYAVIDVDLLNDAPKYHYCIIS